MNAKDKELYYVLTFNEDDGVWTITNQHLLHYHEAKSLQEKYDHQSIITKVVDRKMLEEFLQDGNRKYKNKEN